MSVDADRFRSVLGRFASGVTVVTAVDPDGRGRGLTVSAFCSASLAPPLVLVCIDRRAPMAELLDSAEYFGVSILAADQEAISRRFAEPGRDEVLGLGHTCGRSGVALLAGAAGHLECRIVGRHPAGDHTIYLGEVESAEPGTEPPLLYYRGGYAQLER